MINSLHLCSRGSMLVLLGLVKKDDNYLVLLSSIIESLSHKIMHRQKVCLIRMIHNDYHVMLWYETLVKCSLIKTKIDISGSTSLHSLQWSVKMDSLYGRDVFCRVAPCGEGRSGISTATAGWPLSWNLCHKSFVHSNPASQRCTW